MKRISIMIAIALYAGASAAGAPTVELDAKAAAPFSARIVYLEGEVTVDGVPAEIGMEMGRRVSVRTGEKSMCDIVYNEKNALSINQKADAVIDFEKAVAQVEMNKGGFAAVLRKLGKASGGDAFQVRTKAATAGVRGTSFCVWTDGDSSYVCACNGTVRTIDVNGGNEFTLRAAHHTAKLYTAAGGYISAETAGMLHHTDESVERLAERIGEKIDWTVPD